MKKLSLLLVIAFYYFAVSAQEIVLTFNAADPNKTIDSIKVTNVKSGNSATIIGETTVDLQTVLTSVNGIQNREREMTVYPNPFNENTTVEYSLNEAEEVTILLSNSLGQTVATKKVKLNSGMHYFTVSTANTGIYYVSMHSSKGVESSKIIALSKGNQGDKIEYVGFEDSAKPEKSALYNSGELIHIELSSGDDKTIIADTPTESKTYSVEFYKCQDTDGKYYKIVQIGGQWWMAENLAYLPQVSPPSEDSYSEPYFYVYNYKGTNTTEAKASEYYKTYGVLYNWPAAKVSCPEAWHLPSNGEWDQLKDYLIAYGYNYDETTTDNKIAKSMASTTNWWVVYNAPGGPGYHQTTNNNTSGFSGLPGGSLFASGSFGSITEKGNWWSATKEDDSNPWIWYLSVTDPALKDETNLGQRGFSVRCIKD